MIFAHVPVLSPTVSYVAMAEDKDLEHKLGWKCGRSSQANASQEKSSQKPGQVKPRQVKPSQQKLLDCFWTIATKGEVGMIVTVRRCKRFWVKRKGMEV